MSMEKLVLKRTFLKVGKEELSKQNEKGYKHIKLGFPTSVLGAISAVNCID